MLTAGAVIAAMALPQFSRAFDGPSDERPILLAQKEDPKKKKDPPKVAPKPQPKAVQQPQPVPKTQPQPKTTTTPKPTPKVVQDPKTTTKPKVTTQPKVTTDPKTTTKPKVTTQPKVTTDPKTTTKPKVTTQPKVTTDPKTTTKPKVTTDPKTTTQPKTTTVPKQDPKVTPAAKTLPKQDPKGGGDPKTKAVTKTGPGGTGDPKATKQFGKPKAQPGPQVVNVKEIKGKRKEVKGPGGKTIIVEPGNRRLVREKDRIIVLHDDSARIRRFGNAKFELRGKDRWTIVRRGNYEIVTVTDANGRLLRRFRRGPDGREYVLIDNRRRFRPGVAVAVGGLALLGLAAPVIRIPRDRYIVNYETAPPALLYETLAAPPVEKLERPYDLDEIRDNVQLRDYVRSIDIAINFASGSWEIGEEEVPKLQALAEAILKLIEANPDTVIMLEGHTDAVGSREDNASLSDRRAEAVAEIFTSEFQIPPENLVTQGYGEQHLRVQTDGPSRENRRVQARNITELLNGGQSAGGGPPGRPPG
jgi:outer membrane protein OmpA-like peptidoglycan-associated protein